MLVKVHSQLKLKTFGIMIDMLCRFNKPKEKNFVGNKSIF